MQFAGKWMKLESIMLSKKKKNQSQRQIAHSLSPSLSRTFTGMSKGTVWGGNHCEGGGERELS
jgi:hypothetical protein